MRFQQFPPPAHLTGTIRCFWTVDSGSDTGAARSFNTVSDGFPGLMAILPGGSVVHDSEIGEMVPAFLYGQATTFRTLTAEGTLRALGVFFQPHALRTAFGLKAPQLTDGCYDLARANNGSGQALCEVLRQVATPEQGIQLLTTYITEHVEANKALHDAAIIGAAEHIVAANGDVSIPDACERAGLNERTFERRFKQSIGVSPRLFARIRRFQHTLHLLRTGSYTKLSDIAYAADYADQSHYIRSFKEFTGIAPLEFRRDGNEVVENLVELPPDRIL